MQREAQKPSPNGHGPDHVEKLRLLVTLQNQIVEQARRNRQAEKDCAKLSQRIVRENTCRETGTKWNLLGLIRRAAQGGWLRGWRGSGGRAPGRTNGSPVTLRTDGDSSTSPGELAVAKPVRNR